MKIRCEYKKLVPLAELKEHPKNRNGHGEAQIQYLDGDFRVISPGTYVRCAVTDARIPLDELKYWSVDLQEAYAIPSAVLQRHFPGALK